MNIQKQRRQRRTRAKVQGTANRPRLSVYRSNRGVAVQLIDDQKHVTVLGLQIARTTLQKEKKTKSEHAKALGLLVAQAALEKKIKEVVFDKGRYAYHGRVKAVAQGAREGGLRF